MDGNSAQRRGAHRDSVLLDDVADAEAIAGNRTKAEETQGRVAAVRGRNDRGVEDGPSRVSEELGQSLRDLTVGGRVVPGR